MKSPLVVGYKGEIGRFILSGLLEVLPKANNILCTDINNTRKETIERIKKADVIFLCVELSCTSCWLQEYSKYLKGKIIVEQCSVKNFIYKNPYYKFFNIFSMHLLFRPSTTPKEKRRVAFLSNQALLPQGKNRELARTICSIVKCSPVYFVDANHHDLEMAKNQALAHRVILVLGKILQDSIGKTYVDDCIIDLYNRIKAGDSYLYQAIQNNDWTISAINEFQREFDSFDIKKYWPVV